jgi:hypothetical protein
MTTIAALDSPQIVHSEFVRMTIGKVGAQNIYTFCNAAAPITVDGITFSNLGALLTVSDVQKDIRSTSDDLTISLTGIDPTVVGIILGANVKGSLVEVWRGFFDSNNQIITTPTTQFFKRYQGIINNISISEQFDTEKRIRVATCSVACSSMRRVLENLMSGIKTNQNAWQNFYPNDTSMNRVATISTTYFDFGQPPKPPVSSDDTTPGVDTSIA